MIAKVLKSKNGKRGGIQQFQGGIKRRKDQKVDNLLCNLSGNGHFCCKCTKHLHFLLHHLVLFLQILPFPAATISNHQPPSFKRNKSVTTFAALGLCGGTVVALTTVMWWVLDRLDTKNMYCLNI